MIIAAGLSILWFVVWLLLSWPPSTGQVVAGFFVSLFVTFMTIDLFEKRPGGDGTKGLSYFLKIPVRIFWFVVYVFVFIWQCLRANIDVAFRVIHPGLPIRPGTVKIKTDLKSDTAITLLANSMTLTPGTTTIDVDKDSGYLYVHWLCVKELSGAPCQLPSAKRYEWLLKRVFE